MSAIPHTRGPVRRFLAFLLIALLLAHFPAAAGGNDNTVTVTMGEPTAWSLEQAHYLLERMHAVNHGLNSKTPDTDALDPNATNGSRIEVLRTVLAAAAQFNAPLAAETEAKLDNFQLNTDRRRNLLARLDQLRARHQEITTQLAALRAEQARLQASADTAPQAAQLAPQIQALETERSGIDTQMTSLTTELSTAVTPPELDAPTPTIGGDSGVAPKVADSMAGDLISKALEGTGTGLANPRLHVSTVLDNHIQMQYEIIAKQLSLLRDEVGPDQRVIFLELPVSIYSVPKRADKKAVQVKWRIEEVCLEPDLRAKKIHDELLASNRSLGSVATVIGRQDEASQKQTEMMRTEGLKYTVDLLEGRDEDSLWNVEKAEERVGPLKTWNDTYEVIRPLLQDDASQDQAVQREAIAYAEVVRTCEDGKLWKPVDARNVDEKKLRARVVDLVPRQSALNVNQIYDTSKVGAFGLQALWTGFGAAAQFQRQRELFEQFIHQDIFASGFGKGETEFGWTFGALPGTKRIAPGVRSTFAVVVVPRDALAIKLHYAHDVYKMKKMPEISIGGDYFPVPLPSVDQGFRVDRITYTPVEPGKKVSAFLTGTGFSPQVGVLVNGVPLRRAISLGRPKLVSNEFAAAFDGAPADSIEGEYELVNSQRIALQFLAGANYEGTPSITLVTPQKASLINHYRLSINGLPGRNSLVSMSKSSPMFLPCLEVQDIYVHPGSCTGGTPSMCDVDIMGKGFRPDATIWINDQKVSGRPSNRSVSDPEQDSTTVYKGRVVKPDTSELKVVMRQPTRQRLEEVTVRLPNRLIFRTGGYEVVGFEKHGKQEHAFVNVRVGLLGTNPSNVTAEQLGPYGPTRLTSTPLASGDLLVKLKNTGESLLLQLTRATDSQREVVPVVIPAPPRIRAIAGPSGKATGLTTGGYLVTIEGTNLQDVKRVFFGTSAAAVQRTTPSELVVTAPAGSAGSTLIRLETDVKLLGRFLDNGRDPVASSSFTYEAPPKP